MSKKTWNEVVALIRPLLDKATNDQGKLIDLLNLDLSKEMPRLVVAAKLRDQLADVINLPLSSKPNARVLSFIEFLKKDQDGKIEPQSNAEAEAWLHHLRLLRRVEHLERIKIEAGDIVEIQSENCFAEVSSIGEEGRIYFKGGYGFGSWPDLLTVRARRNDNSSEAERVREKARNCAVLAAPIGEWSEAKHRELSEHEVKEAVTKEDIVRLKEVIDSACDEKPIQKHLEEKPQIITALIGGKNRYCLPQKRLGAEYVPDFLIGDTDSLGISWVLIELETPKSAIYLKTNDQLDEYARKGVSQIQEWREWLTSNIAYARNNRMNNGLGLIDIRPLSRAVVLVGRRTNMRVTKEIARNQLRDSENIHIHTYDWLLEQLNGALTFSGPPGFNPHLIQPEARDLQAGLR